MDHRPETIPVVPLRGLAVLPGEVLHCDIGRTKSLKAVELAAGKEGLALFCAQPNQKLVEVSAGDFAAVGTVCRVRQIFRMQGESIRVLVTGVARARILHMEETDPCFMARIEYLTEESPAPEIREALRRKLKEGFTAFAEAKGRLNAEQRDNVLSVRDFGSFVDAVGRNVVSGLEDKQRLVELCDEEERALALLTILHSEFEVLEAEKNIQRKVQEAADANRKEFMLREQLRAVREELGDTEEDLAEEFYRRMEEKTLPAEVRAKLEKEIRRFADLPRGSHEAPMAQSYIEWILDLPWSEATEDNLDLDNARAVLDANHYGMEKIKERILEMLAVQQLTGNPQGQILCLVGPPGVGKTSIASAIAEAMGRKFVRMSLGGIRDEAEIRGFRRTYIGSAPGRVISAMKQAGTVNPLLLFDEIDKLTSDSHGDPAAAMLEVLDSAQNNAFTDHFLEVPYDLSRCLLMTTANDPSGIPAPLLDRMEVLEVPGYLFDEKLEIAKRHLLPKRMEKNGLKKSRLRCDDKVLSALIEGYTREAGVRQLDRVLDSVCRKAACQVVAGKERVSLSMSRLTDWLGPVKYRRDQAEKEPMVGLVNGLAWTAVGGTTLEIEVSTLPGKGDMLITGQLGDVMQESARAALTFVKANAEVLGIDPTVFDKTAIHIHVPEGAVPKDGPSAGISMMTALASAMSGRKVRSGLAMTGEITLRGRVLAIGGLREKLLAAVRAGITTVIIPEENRRNLYDVPEAVKNALTIRTVSHALEVAELALLPAVPGEDPGADGASPAEKELPAIMPSEESHGAVCH